jgi:hypothetical protein
MRLALSLHHEKGKQTFWLCGRVSTFSGAEFSIDVIGVSPVGVTKTSRGGDKTMAVLLGTDFSVCTVRGGENDVAGGSTSICTGGDGLARCAVARDSTLVSINGDVQ